MLPSPSSDWERMLPTSTGTRTCRNDSYKHLRNIRRVLASSWIQVLSLNEQLGCRRPGHNSFLGDGKFDCVQNVNDSEHPVTEAHCNRGAEINLQERGRLPSLLRFRCRKGSYLARWESRVLCSVTVMNSRYGCCETCLFSCMILVYFNYKEPALANCSNT